MDITPEGLQEGRLNAAACGAAVDTDGYIYVHRGSQAKKAGGTPSHNLVVAVENTDPRMVNWLLELYGGQIHLVQRPSRRDLFRWEVGYQRAYEILSRVQPYLCQKLPVALIGQAFRRHKLGWTRGKKLTPKEIAIRDAFRQATSACNEGERIPASAKRTIAGGVDKFDARFLQVEPYRFEHPLTQIDWVILARFLDYDGTAGMKKEEDLPGRRSPKFSLAPSISAADRELAQNVANLFDLGSPQKVRDDNGELSTYRVTFCSRKAVPLLEGVHPYSFKAGAVEIMLEFQRRNHRHGSGGPGNTLPANVVAWRNAAHEALRYLRQLKPIPDQEQIILAEGEDFDQLFPEAAETSRFYGELEQGVGSSPPKAWA